MTKLKTDEIEEVCHFKYNEVVSNLQWFDEHATEVIKVMDNDDIRLIFALVDSLDIWTTYKNDPGPIKRGKSNGTNNS